MSIASTLYHKVTLSSPKVEVAVRCFYWDHVKLLMKYRSALSVSSSSNNHQPADFYKVMDFLKAIGIKDDDITVIHSSFGVLKGTGWGTEQIIDQLIALVPNGTVAMPAIRHFGEEGEGKEYILNYIDAEYKDVVTKYDIYRTPITSGLLPFTLMRYDDAEISEFPLNPMVAIGKHAEEMMEHNLDGNYPSAHGSMSSWAYCATHDAWNIGLGVDIKDFLTIFHIYQECGDWPVKDWYFKRKFIIKKGKREKEITINERRHKWTKYFAEQNFYNDLLKNGLLVAEVIDGIPVYAIKSSVLAKFVKNQKYATYPYFIPKKELK